MAPLFLRSPRGKKAFGEVTAQRGKNVSTIAALTCDGIVATKIQEGAIKADVFEQFVQERLAPYLRPGKVLLLDNSRIHKSEKLREIVAKSGAKLLFLPAYSPDFMPIEYAFAKMKTIIRKAQRRDFLSLILAIKHASQQVTKSDAVNFFKSCGYGV